MDKLFAFLPLLRVLVSPKPYRVVVAWVLRIFAFATPLAFIWLTIELFRYAGQSDSTELIFFSIVADIVLLAYLYFLANVLWFRAATISETAQSDSYPVTLIFSDLLRLGGEVLAVSLFATGLLAFFAGLFPMAGEFVSMFMPMMRGAGGFVGGLISLALMTVAAFFVVLLSYFLAELSRVMVDISNNTKKAK